jgi:hypothetical protein
MMGRKFTNKMALLIGAEGAGNYGIPPTPYDNTNYEGVIVSSPNIKPTGEKIVRDFVRTTFTKTANGVGRKLNAISFNTEFKGTNNAANPESSFYLHTLMKACGLIPVSLTWLSSTGTGASVCDKVYLIELKNTDNCHELTLYENLWMVDNAATPLNVKAVVVGLGRRKDSDADTAHNDLLAIAIPTASTVDLTKTHVFRRDNAGAPAALTIVEALFVASASVMWRGAAFMPTSAYQSIVDQAFTAHYQLDDIRHESPGCLGSFQLVIKDGSVPSLDFNITGLWKDPIDLAPIAGIVFPDWQPPSVCRANFIIAQNGGAGVGLTSVFRPSFTQFSFDIGTAVTLIPNCNATECAGEVGITDRNSKGSVDPLVDSLSAFNPWSTWSAGSTKFISFCIGYAATGDKGKVVMFNAPEAVFEGNGYQDRSGMAAYAIELSFAGNADDEFVFIFG